MALTTYTTYAAIRALLGVASTEITDTVLALPHYDLQFTLDSEDIDGGEGEVLAQYATITAIEAGSRSANQVRFLLLVNLFAAYSVARQLLGSAEMFAPKKITDGSAATERVNDPFSKMREGVNAGYTTVRTRLSDLLVVLVPSANITAATTRTYILASGLGTDPVTNV
jgi:hypothetical protein